MKGTLIKSARFFAPVPQSLHLEGDHADGVLNTIAMSVTVAGKNSGSVTLDNRSTKQSVSHTFKDQPG
ncbi:hypothetical protein F5Y17DRAFT_457458 [Xylariaceae sp. FL0594]|nr:hypothetical protein F5Y17DRAFT_457458 [Xylariaceae sp. FL0594]